MDEVDNIIIHSLRQIGCNIDDETTTLANLLPENLVEAISKCLTLIKPDLDIPKSLPSGIAQRFSVTTTLAEACSSVGFRGDIGYQTFLYSNITEVRRVFMFLIERLPKESDKTSFDNGPCDKKSILVNNILQNIQIQLNAAWTPQYCKKFGVRSFGNTVAIQASNNGFLPQNLNVPHATRTNISSELHEYWLKRSPTIFQQTGSSNICATIIHKNDIDYRKSIHSFNSIEATLQNDAAITTTISTAVNRNFQKLLQLHQSGVNSQATIKKEHVRNIKSIQQLTLNNIEIPNENDIVVMPEISELDAIRFQIEKIKGTIEQFLQHRQQLQANINECKEEKLAENEVITKLKSEKKIKGRTNLLLENPEVNFTKMENVLATTQERIKKLNEQWQEHRLPLVEQLETSRQSSTQKFSHTKQLMDQIKSMRDKAEELTDDLKHKVAQHAQLIGEFEKNNRNISRNAYTSRILEIIGNIKKQKADIDKIIRDTRELQKEINTINGQLDRQFTVTDDLLFKSAKKDEPSKKAYKLLATLHSDCGDLVQMVQDTGNVLREVRDLEDQIESERNRNISVNLVQITNDLKLLDLEAKEIQQKINTQKCGSQYDA